MNASVTDGPDALGDGGGRADEQAGADDRADAERDERHGTQRPLQRRLAARRDIGQRRSIDLVRDNAPATMASVHRRGRPMCRPGADTWVRPYS